MGHHYVLIHGACHGAWEWFRLSDRLQKAGNEVTALDLAGCGIRPEEPNAITSFTEYNKPVEDFMASLPEGEKVVLIGHSLAGLTNLQIMEHYPQKIGLAIAISSMVVPSAVKVTEYPPVRDYLAQQQSPFSKAVEYTFANGPNKPPTSWKVPPSKIGDILYNGCESEVVELAKILQRPFPTTMLTTDSITYTPERAGKVPWVYIKQSQDRVCLPALQNFLTQSFGPFAEIVQIDTCHLGFLQKPDEFCEIVLQAVEKNFK